MTLKKLSIVFSFWLLVSCTKKDLSSHSRSDQLSGNSIFHLEGSWKKKNGQTMQLKELSGSPIVLAMVYSSCEYVCPRIIADVKKIEVQMKDSNKEVKYVLLTFDPKRDHPKRLKEYSKEKGIDKPNWFFMSSDDDTVLETAAVLGVKYKLLKGGDYSHSNTISIIDRKGVVVFQQVGLNQDPSLSLDYLRKIQ